jgi:HipA-like C-terminal domain
MLSISLPSQILTLLRERGQQSSRQLQAATGMSQKSISLALTSIGEQVCRMGAARSTRYAATKDILGLAAKQPFFINTAQAESTQFGQLTHLQDGSIFAETLVGDKTWLSAPNKLPWFLRPLQPQGFLGRMYKQLRPDFPDDPATWTAAQTLYLAINHITHPPGAITIGSQTQLTVPFAPVEATSRLLYYDATAVNIGKTLPAQSSAGGEQPKFLAEINGDDAAFQHLIVKFSPPHNTPFGQRWRQLLHLEKLAHNTLSAQGIAVAKTNIVESQTRTYLESQRFDRIGIEGKRHVVAIDALHDEFVGGSRHNWVHTCEQLVIKKMLPAEILSQVATIYAFGQYIGNTDMHFGNLSFFVDDVVKPKIRLAPVYDMLPMMWRPGIHTGELDATPVRDQPQVIGYAKEYAEARQWAAQFWQRAMELGALDDALRRAAAASLARIRLLT